MKSPMALLACLAGGLLLAGCNDAPPAGYGGYVEGEYVRVAAPLSGTLARLDVVRGQFVAQDAPLFVLESEQERAARSEAAARVASAAAAVANLEKGRRAPEIDALRSQQAQADAALRASEAELDRARKLVADRFLPAQRYDEALARRDSDRARVAELGSQIAVARLPARSDEIAVARAALEAAGNALAQAQWRLDQKARYAPAAGLVVDTLYRPGEFVGAGVPVVSLLPPGNRKVRFYVPETDIAGVQPGAMAHVHCDGCAAPIAVRIDFIAPEAEYTPPVIYSRENRAKLVFLVEARPLESQPALNVGLPVEVTLDRKPPEAAPR